MARKKKTETKGARDPSKELDVTERQIDTASPKKEIKGMKYDGSAVDADPHGVPSEEVKVYGTLKAGTYRKGEEVSLSPAGGTGSFAHSSPSTVPVTLVPHCIECGARLPVNNRGATAPGLCSLENCPYQGKVLKVPVLELEFEEIS